MDKRDFKKQNGQLLEELLNLYAMLKDLTAIKNCLYCFIVILTMIVSQSLRTNIYWR